MKMLSFQPASLYQNGGAARVLRRLYLTREDHVTSIALITSSAKGAATGIPEKLVTAIPLQRKWMRWHLRTLATWLRENILKFLTTQNIRKSAGNVNFDIIHIVSHGPFANAFDNSSLVKGKKVWVSFHDHFSTADCSFEETRSLWERADRRLVISEELGKEYQRLFDKLSFEIITDGVLEEEISEPSHIDVTKPIIIYFAGLLHIDYYPLFRTLAEALDLLSSKKIEFKLILRGTQKINFLDKRSFEVEYRSDFVSDEEIKHELDSASILYLPIKFTLPNFYLYSLSTKMIGYFGAAGSILYHGPNDSAACNLLKKTKTAVICKSLEVSDMIESLNTLVYKKVEVSENAKVLARAHFNLREIQDAFWEINK